MADINTQKSYTRQQEQPSFHHDALPPAAIIEAYKRSPHYNQRTPYPPRYTEPFPSTEIFPLAVNDVLRQIKKTKEPSSFTFTDLSEIINASEIDILREKITYEQSNPEWLEKKLAVEKAKEFYSDSEKKNHPVNITIKNGTATIGVIPGKNYFTFTAASLSLDNYDVNRFTLQLAWLIDLKHLVKKLQKGEPLDAQGEQPALLDYITDQRDLWEGLAIYEETPEKVQQEASENVVVFTELFEKISDYPTKEERGVKKKTLDLE